MLDNLALFKWLLELKDSNNSKKYDTKWDKDIFKDNDL